MKHLFIKSLWGTFLSDLAGFVSELYVERQISGLTVEQQRACDVLYFMLPRIHNFNTAFGVCMLIDDVLDDDMIADNIDQMMQCSPRLQNWGFTKILAGVLVAWVTTFRAERRVAA